MTEFACQIEAAGRGGKRCKAECETCATLRLQREQVQVSEMQAASIDAIYGEAPIAEPDDWMLAELRRCRSASSTRIIAASR